MPSGVGRQKPLILATNAGMIFKELVASANWSIDEMHRTGTAERDWREQWQVITGRFARLLMDTARQANAKGTNSMEVNT